MNKIHACNTEIFSTKPKKRILNGPYLQFNLWSLININKTRAQSEETVLSSAVSVIFCTQNQRYIQHVAIAQLIESDQNSKIDFFNIAVLRDCLY